ncbi:hypothetical protein VHEMI04694 [[Torrubiella] hemipterigena]|uniref:Choline transport protein n=1 Tax=[Torrubiella] hemipterigena TaxID=1531966 RepID=A0A0A1T1Y8_9HYPO|nr:hypothetical protein VHEMI04694 [[Torrubiella] hemipterigena]
MNTSHDEPSSSHGKGHDLTRLNTEEQTARDIADLAALGHSETLSRKFNKWSMLSLAFCVLGTWTTNSQSFATGLNNGGPLTILWGLALVLVCNLCVAFSLGELTSSMPTALGQAYWIIRIWDSKWSRFVSYMCAWINTFGWWTLTASQNAFMTDFLLEMKVMFDPDWDGVNKGWVKFLIYIGITVAFTAFNHVACRDDRILPWFNNFVAVGFVALFVAMSLALPIAVGTRDGKHFQTPQFVFGGWINNTGWPNGVAFLLGLAQSAYGLTAFDSVIHMVEEIPAPRKNVPLVMNLSIICGAVSGWLFMVVCLFCIQDVDELTNSDSNVPWVQLVQDAVGLEGAAVFISLFIFNGFGQGISILTSSSRLTWSFARDGGMPFFNYFSFVDKGWNVPVRALWLQAGIVSIVGVLYLFSSTVLSAIFSVSTIALTISYAMPITVVFLQGTSCLPPGGEFSMGRWAPVVNIVALAYCAVTTVFFFFPGSPDPSTEDMNYAIAVFGVMIVISLIFWFTKGNKSYMQDEHMAQILYADATHSDTQEPLDPVTPENGKVGVV